MKENKEILSMTSNYNHHSTTQRAVLKDWIVQINEWMEKNAQFEDGCINFTEFGVSTGGNSVDPWSRWIQTILSKWKGCTISFLLTDLPSNDWSVTLNTVSPAVLSSTGQEKIMVGGMGRSFTQQVRPSDSTHFCFSAVAVHWLTNSPCALYGAGCFSDEACYPAEARQAWLDQAAKDWSSFMSCRARELKIGGRLFFTAP